MAVFLNLQVLACMAQCTKLQEPHPNRLEVMATYDGYG
jgi:hypothetical protein